MSETKSEKTRDDSNVYVLLPSDDVEQQVCREFWDGRYPTSKAKLVSTLLLQRLTSDHLLVALSRQPPERPKFTPLDVAGKREALGLEPEDPNKPAPTLSQRAFMGLQYRKHPGYVPGCKVHYWLRSRSEP